MTLISWLADDREVIVDTQPIPVHEGDVLDVPDAVADSLILQGLAALPPTPAKRPRKDA